MLPFTTLEVLNNEYLRKQNSKQMTPKIQMFLSICYNFYIRAYICMCSTPSKVKPSIKDINIK